MKSSSNHNNMLEKVGQKNNSSELKARNMKSRIISRFQLLIIYIHKNIMKQTNTKVGERIYSAFSRNSKANLLQPSCNRLEVRLPKIGIIMKRGKYKKYIREGRGGGVCDGSGGNRVFGAAEGAEAAFSYDAGL